LDSIVIRVCGAPANLSGAAEMYNVMISIPLSPQLHYPTPSRHPTLHCHYNNTSMGQWAV